MSEGESGLRFSDLATIVVLAIILGPVFGIAGAWLNIGPIGVGIIAGGTVGVLTAIYLKWSRRRRNDLAGL